MHKLSSMSVSSSATIWMGKQRFVIKSEHESVQLRNSSRSLVWMRVAGGGGAVLFCFALNLLGGVLAIITMPSGCSHSPDFVPVGEESRGGGCRSAYRLI